jgi:hypothetical protein
MIQPQDQLVTLGYLGPEEELTQNAMALVGRTLTLTGSQP